MEWPSLQRIENYTNDGTGSMKQLNPKGGRNDDNQAHSDTQALNRETLAHWLNWKFLTLNGICTSEGKSNAFKPGRRK
jgi:hypothetical protein